MWPFMLMAVILQLLELLNVLPNPWSSPYVVRTELRTWEEAFDFCRMEEMDLVYVNGSTDPKLNDLLTSIIPQLEKDPKFKTGSTSNKTTLWVRFNTSKYICNETDDHTHSRTMGGCKELLQEGRVKGTTLEASKINATTAEVTDNLEGNICDFIQINYSQGSSKENNSSLGKSGTGNSSGGGFKKGTPFLLVLNGPCDRKRFTVCQKRG